jgi:hypothetical protein
VSYGNELFLSTLEDLDPYRGGEGTEKNMELWGEG